MLALSPLHCAPNSSLPEISAAWQMNPATVQLAVGDPG
jgi:hypothetical protein